MSAAARTRLATQQAAVVCALVSDGVIPVGFDAEHLHVATESLLRKRCRAVARAWPTLARDLGLEFQKQFAVYAETTPQPRHGGPLADGRGFADWTRQRGWHSEVARLQTLAVDVRFARSCDGLHPRRWATVKFAWLTQPHRLVIALRWPRIGERWFTLRLGR